MHINKISSHEHENGEISHEHAHDEIFDGHIWLNPENAIKMIVPAKAMNEVRKIAGDKDGKITISRVSGSLTYPCETMLVCAMNPCKCGYFGDASRQCTCSAASRTKYLERVSGPLLDRIDIEIELPSVSYNEISGATASGEPSAKIRERVNAARAFTDARLRSGGDRAGILNANMTPDMLHRYCVPTDEGKELLREAFDTLGLSARGHDRILKVARTIADLDGSEKIGADHIAEAIMYRSLDRKYWRR
mgnify:CR=1 FL=1